MRKHRLPIPNPTNEFCGPLPHYWGNHTYRDIVRNNSEPYALAQSLDNEIKKTKASILKSSFAFQVVHRLLQAYVVSSLIGLLSLFFYLWLIQKTDFFGALLILGFVILVWWKLQSVIDSKYQSFEDKIFAKNHTVIHPLELRLKEARIQSKNAERRILSDWDWYCVKYSGYPPDWEERRSAVKVRDDHTCTACGWPNGVKSLRRNLHVHHITNISEGGNNSFDNLTTLCHVCHRKQDGSGHKRIKYVKRRKR